MLMGGCNLGAVYYNFKTLVDDWLFTPQRGALAAVSHSYVGYSGPLFDYLQGVYWQQSKPAWLEKSLGEVIQEYVRANVINYNNTPLITTAQQMNLLGDPALRLFKTSLPDYRVADDSLHIYDQESLSYRLESDTVHIKWLARNEGLAPDTTTSIQIEVSHHYPNGDYVSRHYVSRPAIFSQDTLHVHLPVDTSQNRIGTHTFKVKIDTEDSIAEYDENNNQTSVFREIIIEELPTALPGEVVLVTKLYPNPSTGLLYLEMPKARSIAWELANAHGLKIRNGQGQVSVSPMTLDLSTLPKGLYYLRVELPNGKGQSFKVILR